MTTSVTAHVPTASASRYLQQLCKHWSHNLAVDFDAGEGTVRFPGKLRGSEWPGEAVLTMKAEPAELVCRIEAGAEGQLEVLKTIVSSHLDRFAFREAPLAFDWRTD